MDFDDLDEAEVTGEETASKEQEAEFWEYYKELQPYFHKVDGACEPVRIGVLSSASIIHVGICSPVTNCPQAAQIVGIASRDPEVAHGLVAAVPALHGATVYNTYEELIWSEAVEVVYVPLPNGMHFEWTKKALEAGKHVLLEKPFTANAEEARQLVQLARERGRVLMEGHHWYYHPVRARLLERIAAGVIGEVKEIHFRFRLKMGLPPVTLKKKGTFDTTKDSGKMWIMRRGMAGGLTMTLGTYDINILRTLIGEEPIVVSAEGTCLADDGEMDAIMQAEFFFPKSGVKGTFLAGGMGPEEHYNEMDIIGTDGKIFTSQLMEPQYVPNRIKVMTLKGVEKISDCWTVSGGGYTTYDLQLLAFVDHVRQVNAGECAPDSFPHTGDDCIRQMEVIDNVYANACMRPRWGWSGIVPHMSWSVCGDIGAIVYKKADEKSASAGRLATGAVVKGPLDDHNWLNFTKVSGEGPDSGWVNLKMKDAIVLKPVPHVQ